MCTKDLARKTALLNIHLANPTKPIILVEGVLNALHAKAKITDNVVYRDQ